MVGVERLSPCVVKRHSNKMPHRLTPAAPPSIRTKLMALEPDAIRSLGRPRIDPMFNDGKIKPKPARPSTANSTSTQIGVLSLTSTMTAKDADSRVRPMVTSR